MVERGEGWIVNVSSATGARRSADKLVLETVYGSSKAALNRTTRWRTSRGAPASA